MKLELNKLVNDDEVRLMQRKGAAALAALRVGLLIFLVAVLVDVKQSEKVLDLTEMAFDFVKLVLLYLVGGNAVDKVNDTVARIKGKPAASDVDKPLTQN